MSALLERIKELRVQAGTFAPAEISVDKRRATVLPAPALIMGSPVPESLRRLLGLRERVNAPALRVLAVDREVSGIEISPGLHFTEQFHDWLDAPLTINAAFAGHGQISRTRLLAFDTETTGLAGGTGTRAFMIGVADWQDSRLRLRQLTITTLAAEQALLETFADWLAPDTVLVSYNGKSYDAPLLNTRYRLARKASPLPGLLHLDLLHPTRRRWKGVWENCRLATVERQLLGVVREDDLPGSEAPAAWLDFLRGGAARNLRRVAAHNAQDLRSLVGILLQLSTLPVLALPDATRSQRCRRRRLIRQAPPESSHSRPPRESGHAAKDVADGLICEKAAPFDVGSELACRQTL